MDAGPPEPGVDAGPPFAPPRPAVRWPWNGASTGSIHGSVVLPEPALRPFFDWDDVPQAESYEIQVSDECTTPGFASCAFETPAVSESVTESEFRAPLLDVDLSAPVGRRYYWRVRACAAACSSWSPVRYVDVGRQPNDFDGDGYADVLAGAYLDDGGANRAGRAYWWNGTSTGPGTRNQIAAPVAEEEGRFGLATASIGDVNGDGFADAAISAYWVDVTATDAGEVYIFHGSVDGLPAAPDLVVPAPIAEIEMRFGRSLAPAGDVNGDGFADLVAGAYLEDGGMSDLGSAYVFLGSAGGIVLPFDRRLSAPDAQDNQQFGFPLTGVGDVDGDGFADVLVGERYWDVDMLTNTGRSHLFAGTASGVSDRAAVTFLDPMPSDGAQLSYGLAGVGDLDGDRFADVAIGARLRAGGGGALVFLGGASGPSSTPDVTLVQPDGQDAAEFGFAIAPVGDINGDGRSDVVISARYYDRSESNEGRAYVYYGTADGVLPTEPDVVLNGSPRENGAQYGYSAGAARDVDGDGLNDLVIGALNQDQGGVNHGAVFFYRGEVGGLNTTPVVLGTNRLDGRLGSSVAVVPAY